MGPKGIHTSGQQRLVTKNDDRARILESPKPAFLRRVFNASTPLKKTKLTPLQLETRFGDKFT